MLFPGGSWDFESILSTSFFHGHRIQFPSPEDQIAPGPVLTALDRFRNFKTLRLYGCFEEESADVSTLSSPLKYSHIRTDTLTVQRIFSYLHKYKQGAEFEKIEVLFGDFHESSYLMEEPKDLSSSYHRPEVLLTCRVGDGGEIMVKNDCTAEDYQIPWFNYYFNDASLDEERSGYSYMESFAGCNGCNGKNTEVEDDDDFMFESPDSDAEFDFE